MISYMVGHHIISSAQLDQSSLSSWAFQVEPIKLSLSYGSGAHQVQSGARQVQCGVRQVQDFFFLNSNLTPDGVFLMVVTVRSRLARPMRRSAASIARSIRSLAINLGLIP